MINAARTAWRAAVLAPQLHPASMASAVWCRTIKSILELEQGKTRLTGTAPGGFEVNSVRVHGSVMCFPEMWSLWRPRRLADVTPESLAALEVLTPAPEVLVVGCGRAPGMLPPATMSFLRSRGIAVELVDSQNAVGYFNVLNEEGRVVVAALLPLNPDLAEAPLPMDPDVLAASAEAAAAAGQQQRAASPDQAASSSGVRQTLTSIVGKTLPKAAASSSSAASGSASLAGFVKSRVAQAEEDAAAARRLYEETVAASDSQKQQQPSNGSREYHT